MKIISKIEIRKFRSIKNCTRDLYCSSLNVLVGKNDNGKSNILRALNLFFNGETDVGQTLRFDDDYCYHADSGTGTRREIRIDLFIDPPKARFKHARALKWTKRWKKDGSVIEERIYVETGNAISQKDNVSKWLDKLNYRYVPAIKGRDYFNSLMGELHDVLHETHETVLATQGEGFIAGIQNVTKDITEELERQIGVPNTIQVPSDFRSLFSNLDFGSKMGGNTYHLKQRGDGIKIRHIPIILKYIAEQEKNISIPGYVKPDTIWGFEEPENNLELRYAFEMAENFLKYSKDLQIFVTTHSPAFYALDSGDEDETTIFFIQKNPELCTDVKKITHHEDEGLHEKMGILPVITPYLKQIYDAQQKIEGLENELLARADTKKCIVITEDSNSSALKAIFEANNFIAAETEFFSYDGKDQIKGALILGRYVKQKKEDIQVIVHRDRDYLTDEIIDDYANRFEKDGLHFFCTDGVDAESHLLSAQHIISLGYQLPTDEIEALIDQATELAKEASFSRMLDELLHVPKGKGVAKELSKLTTEFQANPTRYRYGKKVLGHLKGKLQQKLKTNIDLERPSDALKHPKLTEIAAIAWGGQT